MNDRQKEDIRALIKAQEILKNFIGSKVEAGEFHELFIYVNAFDAIKEVVKLNPLPSPKVDLAQQKIKKDFTIMLESAAEGNKKRQEQSESNRNNVLNDNRLIGETKPPVDIIQCNYLHKIIFTELNPICNEEEINLIRLLILDLAETDTVNIPKYKTLLTHFNKRIEYIRKFYLTDIPANNLLNPDVNPIRHYNEQVEAFEYMNNLIREHIIYLES